jgi:hypothetical protein
MEPADTFEHAGLKVNILYEEFDQEHANPRNQDGNIGVMFCDYGGYTLGDEDAPDPRDQKLACDKCKGSGESELFEILDIRGYGRVLVRGGFSSRDAAEEWMEQTPRTAEESDTQWKVEPEDCPECEGGGEVEVGMVEYLVREHGARVILPLFVYEHSGITMRAGANLVTGSDNLVSRGRFAMDGAGWDTSTVGMIFDTAETRKACGFDEQHTITDEDIEKQLDEEVVYYAAYLEGAVYGYEVLDGDGEVLDSCWGFLEPECYKDDAYVKVEARDAAEYCAERIVDEKAEALRWACADVVTV